MIHPFSAGLRCTVGSLGIKLKANSSKAPESRRRPSHPRAHAARKQLRIPRRHCKLVRTKQRSNGRAARTWRTAFEPVLIVQAFFGIGSSCCLQLKLLQSIRPNCSARPPGWPGCSHRSTPSAAVLERVRDRRRHTYLQVRRHMARMAGAAATRADGRRRRKVVLRLLFTPS